MKEEIEFYVVALLALALMVEMIRRDAKSFLAWYGNKDKKRKVRVRSYNYVRK